MEAQELCCPYCETVMEQRYNLHMPEHIWYECPICGHRAVQRGDAYVTPEDETEIHSPLQP
jgi:hypothetical protein